MKYKFIEGDRVPPITIDLTRNGDFIRPPVGKFKIELQLTYPDKSIEIIEHNFEVLPYTKPFIRKKK